MNTHPQLLGIQSDVPKLLELYNFYRKIPRPYFLDESHYPFYINARKKQDAYIVAIKKALEHLIDGRLCLDFDFVPKKTSGVYFLYSSTGDILYIGQSINIGTRIKAHKDKKYSFFSYIKETYENERIDMERYYIKKYAPPFNIQYK